MTFVIASLPLFLAARQGDAASLQPVEDFGANPGQLDMYVYLPEERPPAPALVVALHGCDQRASDFDDETGLAALADAQEFILLLPQQREANNEKRCFNWFQDEDTTKGQGESGSIESMIQYAVDSYHANPSKIFVLGLSAGGSMTTVLMANYPALFQGGAVVAGTPFDCNRPSFWTWAQWWWLRTYSGDAGAAVLACGLFGGAPTQRSAQEWGDLVRAAAGAAPGHWPKVSLWHGDADDIVSPANQMELVKQWTNVLGIEQSPDRSDVLNDIRHEVYTDASGTPRLETYEIAGFDHAIAVDPGPGPEQCGIVAPYIKDADICSALKILQFWGVAP